MKTPYEILLDAAQTGAKVMSGTCLIKSVDLQSETPLAFTAIGVRDRFPLHIKATAKTSSQEDPIYTVVLTEPEKREITYEMAEHILVDLFGEVYPQNMSESMWELHFTEKKTRNRNPFDDRAQRSKDNP